MWWNVEELISHCVLRLVSWRLHHVSDYFLAGIEGCRYKDQACFFVAHHDDSGWCGCSSNYGVYCGYYGEYGDCISHTAGLLWGDWGVCVIESPRCSLDKRRIFRKSPRPSLPLKRAPPLTPALFNGLYTPFGSPVSGGQKPQGREDVTALQCYICPTCPSPAGGSLPYTQALNPYHRD